MLGAAETPYDLRFTLLGIPVRVHPFFWIVTAALGWEGHNLLVVGIWVACVFASILIHEYGHGLTAKAFGSSPSIVLWGLGGLCYSQAEWQTRVQRLAVILMGPGAGFIFAAVAMLVTTLVFGLTPSEHLGMIQGVLHLGGEPTSALEKFPGVHALMVYEFLLWINLMWGFVNLLPIWPLDGGRVSEIVLSSFDRSQGARWGHVLSLLVAGTLAVVTALAVDLFYGIFFAYFALVNFQILQSLHQAHAMGLYHDDEWWRR
jgi:membrane-associated protease RseP (regulator of RpoE activity)